MKKLIYQIEGYISVYNPKTEEVEQKLSPATITVECNTKAEFDILYATAEKEAMGEILVEGEFDPESPFTSDPVTWDELDSAYENGINSL